MPRVDPRRLGGDEPAYRIRPLGSDCRGRRASVFATTDHTRPHDAANREPGASLEEGFSVDVPDRLRLGERRVAQIDGQERMVGIPIYVEQRRTTVGGRPGIAVAYWMLFGSSESRGRDGKTISRREGDWERVDVLAQREGRSRYRPFAVRYLVDGGRPRTVPWADVEKAGDESDGASTHPVVYAARRSHVPYPTAGEHPRRAATEAGGVKRQTLDTTEKCERCPQWRTWELLREAREQPWYGFGGGWGAAAPSEDRSGPLGPSPYAPVGGDTSKPLPGPPHDGGAGGPGQTVATTDVAARFAPRLNLHPDERLLPARAAAIGDPRDPGARVRRRAGQAVISGIPTYVERRPARGNALRITYWQLYDADIRDWERVSVLLGRAGPDRYVPLSVRYHLGQGWRDIPWTAAKRVSARGEAEATHPVVYVALGSHLPLWRAGRYSGLDDTGSAQEATACRDCPRWQTWEDVRYHQEDEVRR